MVHSVSGCRNIYLELYDLFNIRIYEQTFGIQLGSNCAP